MRKRVLWACLGLFVLAGAFGCHADENDPSGQSEELSDPVRRQNAVENLRRIYSNALANNSGDRAHASVVAVTDAAIDNMAAAYVQHREDSQAGMGMLEVMREMRDPRAIPAFISGLNWERDLSEQHAITSANALAEMDIPADKRREVIQALVAAFNKVRDARPVDVRIMDAVVKSIASIGTPEVTAPLTDIMVTQRENKPFLINRLAAMKLGDIEDAQAVPALIKALFLFDPQNPAMRLEDVATGALVRIGRPALGPLLAVLNGRDAEAEQLAVALIESMAERDPSIRENMPPREYARERAAVALGALGLPEALDPLLAETRAETPRRRLTGAIMLVQLNLTQAQEAQVREALIRVHGSLPDNFMGLSMRAQLMSAMQHTFDSGYLDLFLAQARDRNNHPDIRLTANSAYALIANKQEAARLRQMIAREPGSMEGGDEDSGGYKERFQEAEPALAAADACDMDISCWMGKLSDGNALVVRKAAFMLGRLGRDNTQAIGALIEKLGHPDAQVRIDVLYAIDAIATTGSEAATERLGQLRDREQGTAIWRQVGSEAIRIQGRLRARHAGG